MARLLLLLLLALPAPAAGPAGRGLEEVDAEIAALLPALDARVRELENLSRSYAELPDPREVVTRRNSLRAEATAMRERLRDLHHEHRQLRERTALLRLAQTLARARAKAAPDLGVGNALVADAQGSELESAITSIDDRTRGAALRDQTAFDTALASYRVRRLRRRVLLALLVLLCAAGAAAYRCRPRDLPAGALVQGQYRIERELSRTGNETLYAATDLALGRKVALRCLRDKLLLEPARLEAFLASARSGEEKVYAAFAENGRVFLVSETSGEG